MRQNNQKGDVELFLQTMPISLSVNLTFKFSKNVVIWKHTLCQCQWTCYCYPNKIQIFIIYKKAFKDKICFCTTLPSGRCIWIYISMYPFCVHVVFKVSPIHCFFYNFDIKKWKFTIGKLKKIRLL